MYDQYNKYRNYFAELIKKSWTLSFFLGLITLTVTAVSFYNYDNPLIAGDLFYFEHKIFGTKYPNIVNGIIFLVITILLIRNGINKKWPKVN